jgi:Contact-dependent growth inhibition CdiA C-terminal domain
VVSDNIFKGISTSCSAMSPADIAAARTLARVVGSAIRAVASPNDQLSAFGSSLLGDMLNAMGPPVAEGTTQVGTDAPPPGPQTAFDDDGNLMPGVINTSAPWEQQITQLQTRLQNQGMDAGSAQQLTKAYEDRVLDQAFETFVTDPVRPTLIAAGPGWTLDVRSARQVIDEVENRIANGSLQSRSIGNAIEDTFSAYARLSEAAMQQGASPPTVDQERAASRLISLIGDLGQLASQDDWQLTPEQQTLVQQSRALQAQRNLPDVFGAAASGGILALRQNRAAFERVYGATKPTGALGGRPIGELEASLPNANSTTKGGIDRQNRTIETLAAAGYRVETIPRSNVSRSPDVYVEGRVFDVYSPEAGTSVRNIVTNMGVKASAQSDRIVLDLSQSDITRHELRAAFNAGNTGVREVIVIARDKTIYRLP